MFDLDAGPVTITLPDGGDRFMSLLIIDEDHYALRSSTAPVGTPSTGESRQALRAGGSPHGGGPERPQGGVARSARFRMQLKWSRRAPVNLRTAELGQNQQKKVRDALVVLGETLPD